MVVKLFEADRIYYAIGQVYAFFDLMQPFFRIFVTSLLKHATEPISVEMDCKFDQNLSSPHF
ncbi:MAG TPA: hypothetical protein DD672_00720 [Gammaproteobacteria bacterium]|nr:hypothetical protein [Gammaproteobacteria bacterium]HAO87487.1 hypothetical protein [Gammaproteobacteria bacterium]HBJ89100.1 hypothetical protein [Gammaproteobacteria bacterium]HBP98982.1 hypothetical protein [Gammaproteobacteria bacterium]HCL73518.1 hypothetical protein [Gammaproteobacteria bacterium]